MTTRLPPQCPACGDALNREAWTVQWDTVWCDDCIDRSIIDKRYCIAVLREPHLAHHVAIAHGLHIFAPREPRLRGMNVHEALRVLCSDHPPLILATDYSPGPDADELLQPTHRS